jgi:hypothetical protein
MLEKVEATLVPPPRKWLWVIIDEDDEAEAKEKKEQALAEQTVVARAHIYGNAVHDFAYRRCRFSPTLSRRRPAPHYAGAIFLDRVVQA